MFEFNEKKAPKRKYKIKSTIGISVFMQKMIMIVNKKCLIYFKVQRGAGRCSSNLTNDNDVLNFSKKCNLFKKKKMYIFSKFSHKN